MTVSPQWWLDTRAMYAPAFAGGGGSSLLSYGLGGPPDEPPQFLPDLIESFADLPKLIKEAQGFGTNLLYLNDYWEGGYFIKGDYIPRADLGGVEGMREGVRAAHDMGARVIVYLESFLVHADSRLGQNEGLDWAIMDVHGEYYPYIRRGDKGLIMWPGEGSGYPDHLASVAERLIETTDVDGFHLDSGSLQFGWKSHHPKHTDGMEPGAFDLCTVRMVESLTQRVKAIKPDAIVMTEGSDGREILAACDGAQEWSLNHVMRNPWIDGRKVFTSEMGLPGMERILARGHNVSIARWWLRDMPAEESIEALRSAELPDLTGQTGFLAGWNARGIIRELWWHYDVLWANGRVKPRDPDVEWLRQHFPPLPFAPSAEFRSEAGRARFDWIRNAVVRGFDGADLTTLRKPSDELATLIEMAKQGRLVDHEASWERV